MGCGYNVVKGNQFEKWKYKFTICIGMRFFDNQSANKQ